MLNKAFTGMGLSSARPIDSPPSSDKTKPAAWCLHWGDACPIPTWALAWQVKSVNQSRHGLRLTWDCHHPVRQQRNRCAWYPVHHHILMSWRSSCDGGNGCGVSLSLAAPWGCCACGAAEMTACSVSLVRQRGGGWSWHAASLQCQHGPPHR